MNPLTESISFLVDTWAFWFRIFGYWTILPIIVLVIIGILIIEGARGDTFQ